MQLFGPEVRKMITERAGTIDAFNKAISRVDNPSKSTLQPSASSCFFYLRDWPHDTEVSWAEAIQEVSPVSRSTKES